MRVLLYANADRAHAGGVQAVVRGLRSHLAAREHRVTTGWAEDSAPGGPVEDGWARQFPVRAGSGRWLHLPTAARLAARLLRERPQLVNIHYASPSALYFTTLARRLGFRVVVTCHGSDILRPLRQDEAFIGKVLRHADAVTAVSDRIEARLDELGSVPHGGVIVIPNGVDVDFWRPREVRRAATAATRLVAVGRLERVKGFDLLIDACAEIARKGRPLRLELVGEGSERTALETQARAAGFPEMVVFAGRLPPEAIRDRLHAADIFVLSSRSEGMPLALLEAMASGTPAIAADVGGVSRTATGAVRLVPPESPGALARAIADLLDDAPERAALAAAGRRQANDFAAARSHAAYEELMLSLARARRA